MLSRVAKVALSQRGRPTPGDRLPLPNQRQRRRRAGVRLAAAWAEAMFQRPNPQQRTADAGRW